MSEELIDRTCLIVKPDGVERGLIGDIISRVEKRGLKIIGIKMVRPERDLVEKHYADDEEWMKSVGEKTKKSYKEKGKELDEDPIEIGKRVREWLMNYLSSGPVVAMAIEGYHAIEIVRKIVGSTTPREAKPGTIRGDYSVESYDLGDSEERPVRNIVHASGNSKEADSEIDLWFDEDELYDYERVDWKAIHGSD